MTTIRYRLPLPSLQTPLETTLTGIYTVLPSKNKLFYILTTFGDMASHILVRGLSMPNDHGALVPLTLDIPPFSPLPLPHGALCQSHLLRLASHES